MFDVIQVQKDAIAELNAERAEKAKVQIKAKIKEIENAKRILKNLEVEFEDLLATIGE